MTTIIAVDGLSEEEFRRSIERKLRHGKVAEAATLLREQIAPYAGPGNILPERFLTVAAEDLALTGWESLGVAVARQDKPYRRISALTIAFGWEGEEVPRPNAEGQLAPHIEVGYFTDDAFPFSQSTRDDLLEGYSYHGCTWTGDCEATDTALGLSGIDDLRGALANLEARLLASDAPDEEEILAGSLAACLLSVLLFQTVEARIAKDGLPRPLCVMAGSSGVYPYFDAPVVGMPDEVLGRGEEEIVDSGIPAPRYSSLLVTGVPRGKKRAVLVLEESADEMANRLARLRGINHAEPAPVAPEAEPAPPEPLVPETGITPVPGGPLMTKKPHGPAWDFRDMLGPPPADFGARGDAPAEVEEWGEPEAESVDTAWDEPEQVWDEPNFAEPDHPPATEINDAPRVEPGFALLEPSVQQRLQSLLRPSTPEPTPGLEAPVSKGFGWRGHEEDAEPVPEVVQPEPSPTAIRPSLWMRLRVLLRWQ